MHAKLRLLLTDDTSSSSPTVNIVKDCVRRLNNNAFREFDVEVDVISLHNSLESSLTEPIKDAIILMVISDKAFYSAEVQKLIAFGARMHLIPLSQARFSGFDCITAFLLGILGVVDERYLSLEKVMENLLKFQGVHRSYRRMILIGEMAEKASESKYMLETWQDEGWVEEKYESILWRTSVALAQLSKLEPIIGGSAQPMSFPQLAKALNMAHATTGFVYNNDDLRKVLGVLAKKWLGEEHKNAERVFLPQQARLHGFPDIALRIPNILTDEIAKATFAALDHLSIIERTNIETTPKIVIKLSASEYRRQQLTKE